ncbi:low affinity potassium transporter Kup [uncultured Tolumonas sp.]|uniref:low affinity potassium transporter Kup n=1 Tax=uncultured Tolumonas sp. TaxID=263765 RepID=UPI00292F1983|nr:low affinity potassium transporter Kup [uncultured Tolumonas sp.]
MDAHQKQSLPAITLAAIGVVYGDIGTSPLYTLHECFSPHIGLAPTQPVIFGFLSLIFWSQVLIVSLKYLAFVLRADNRGEGGILTLMSLAGRNTDPKTTTVLLVLGLIGGGLFYGDSIITPAVSVLSALEGMQVIAPNLKEFVVPCSLIVLFMLFFIQKHGTAKVGGLFGPIMVCWFLVLGILGLKQIIANPTVLSALHPKWAFHFFIQYKMTAFIALGAVVLSVTGGEALYADMGHFGKHPIQLAWFTLVSPALILNYFGQGALILSDPAALENPFFLLAPTWALIPLVLLSTAATVIASQAVISGAYSMTRQAVRMGYLPNMTILHTSAVEEGQIYMPFINWLLFFCIVIIVTTFAESSKLAAAYGIAVTGTMAITSILACYVARYNWDWSRVVVKYLGIALLCIDIPFFAANLLKVFEGGWLPLGVGALTFAVMAIWKWERFLLLRQLSRMSMPLEAFVTMVDKESPAKVPGTAIYLSRTPQGIPHALLHNLNHNHVLHERIVLMTFRTQDVPYVDPDQHIEIKELPNNIWRISVTYGFHEAPEVNEVFRRCAMKGMSFNLNNTTFFLSRETLIPSHRSIVARLRAALFIWMSKNSLRTNDFIHVPADRVVEMGVQVEV